MRRFLLAFLIVLVLTGYAFGQSTHVVILKTAAAKAGYLANVRNLSNLSGVSPCTFDDGHVPAWTAVVGKFNSADLAALGLTVEEGIYLDYTHPNAWGPAQGWINNVEGLDKISWTDHGYTSSSVWSPYPIPGAVKSMADYGYTDYADSDDQTVARADGYNIGGASYNSTVETEATSLYESAFGEGEGVWCENQDGNSHIYVSSNSIGHPSPVTSSGTGVWTKDGTVNYCASSFGRQTDYYGYLSSQSAAAPYAAACLARLRFEKPSYNLWDARAALRQTAYNYVQAMADPLGYTGGGVWLGSSGGSVNTPGGGGGYGLIDLERALGLSSDPNDLDLMPPTAVYAQADAPLNRVKLFWKRFRQTEEAKVIIGVTTAVPTYDLTPSGVSQIYKGTNESVYLNEGSIAAYNWKYKSSDLGETYYVVFFSANSGETKFSGVWDNAVYLIDSPIALSSSFVTPYQFWMNFQNNNSGRDGTPENPWNNMKEAKTGVSNLGAISTDIIINLSGVTTSSVSVTTGGLVTLGLNGYTLTLQGDPNHPNGAHNGVWDSNKFTSTAENQFETTGKVVYRNFQHWNRDAWTSSFFLSSKDVEVDGILFRGSGSSSQTGLTLIGSSTTKTRLLTNCVFFDFSDSGSKALDGSATGGTVFAVGNTFYNNQTAIQGGSKATAINNVIAGCTIVWSGTSRTGLPGDYNIADRSSSPTLPGNNSKILTPIFASPSQYDFRMRLNSPTRGQAIDPSTYSSGAANTSDILRGTRPSRGRWDAGAHQFRSFYDGVVGD